MIGENYGQWEILQSDQPIRYNKRWKCRCSCGIEKIVFEYSLKNGSSTNCGCKRKTSVEKCSQIRKFLKKGYTYRDILANVKTSFRLISKIRNS